MIPDWPRILFRWCSSQFFLAPRGIFLCRSSLVQMTEVEDWDYMIKIDFWSFDDFYQMLPLLSLQSSSWSVGVERTNSDSLLPLKPWLCLGEWRRRLGWRVPLLVTRGVSQTWVLAAQCSDVVVSVRLRSEVSWDRDETVKQVPGARGLGQQAPGLGWRGFVRRWNVR